jgi:hypothetical protein
MAVDGHDAAEGLHERIVRGAIAQRPSVPKAVTEQ